MVGALYERIMKTQSLSLQRSNVRMARCTYHVDPRAPRHVRTWVTNQLPTVIRRVPRAATVSQGKYGMVSDPISLQMTLPVSIIMPYVEINTIYKPNTLIQHVRKGATVSQEKYGMVSDPISLQMTLPFFFLITYVKTSTIYKWDTLVQDVLKGVIVRQEKYGMVSDPLSFEMIYGMASDSLLLQMTLPVFIIILYVKISAIYKSNTLIQHILKGAIVSQEDYTI